MTKQIWSDRGHFVNGSWTGAGATSHVENPATRETIATVTSGTVADVDRAVMAAKAALPGWMELAPQQRGNFIARIAQLVEERQANLADAMTHEIGMPLKLTRMIQVGLPLTTFRSTSDLASTFHFEREIGNSRILLEAVGVVAAVTPWNYPLHQIAAKVAPALLAGCTVVVKPADLAPINALLLAEIVEAAGLPPGVFNVVTGKGSVIGQHLATHPDVDMISFTGSTHTGAALARDAAAQIKRVSLELGGKSAAVLLDGCDIEKAVKATVGACFMNSGQTCSALTRLIVPASRADEAAEIAVNAANAFVLGDPFEPATRMGPVISEKQRDGIRTVIDQASADGARLVCGGSDAPPNLDAGYYVKPTVFTDVDPNSRLAQDEVFGPVLAILSATNDDEAISIANNSRYGLAGAVWGASREHAIAAAKRIRTGQIEINGGRFNPLAPFGGFKQSGYGRELGEFGVEEFVEAKALQL